MVKKPYLWRHPGGSWYFRKEGVYVRIVAQPSTPEFDQQYWEIRSGQRANAKRSLQALIESYRASERWTNLKPRTRSDYDKVMRYLLEKTGARDMTKLARKDILAAMEANRSRIRFANYIPQVVSVLCEHAIDLGWRSDNPAKGVRRLKTPMSKERPHNPWPDNAVAKWRSEAEDIPRLIFELGIGSVQRPGDWPNFRWSDYDGRALRITQGKTGRTLHLPCTPQLKVVLDGTPKRGLTILTRSDGRPLPYRRMAEIMRTERKRLGLLKYDLHALRYRGVMELAWAGCDDDEIAAYSGHNSKDMIRKYAGEARQVVRARQAAAKRSS